MVNLGSLVFQALPRSSDTPSIRPSGRPRCSCKALWQAHSSQELPFKPPAPTLLRQPRQVSQQGVSYPPATKLWLHVEILKVDSGPPQKRGEAVEEQRKARRGAFATRDEHLGTSPLPKERLAEQTLGGNNLMRETLVRGEFSDQREDNRDVVLGCRPDLRSRHPRTRPPTPSRWRRRAPRRSGRRSSRHLLRGCPRRTSTRQRSPRRAPYPRKLQARPRLLSGSGCRRHRPRTRRRAPHPEPPGPRGARHPSRSPHRRSRSGRCGREYGRPSGRRGGWGERGSCVIPPSSFSPPSSTHPRLFPL